jgi:hypothetical protein
MNAGPMLLPLRKRPEAIGMTVQEQTARPMLEIAASGNEVDFLAENPRYRIMISFDMK